MNSPIKPNNFLNYIRFELQYAENREVALIRPLLYQIVSLPNKIKSREGFI